MELTGETGDVVLMHPLMPHSASTNHLRALRVITNPLAALKEPFCFWRSGEEGDEYSLVERKTVRALGASEEEGYAFVPTGKRRQVVPARVAIQARMVEEERRRLEVVREKLAVDAGGAAARTIAAV